MDANRTNNAAISAIWNIDYFRGSSTIREEVLNGWQISPIVYLTSGGPFSITTGSTKNDDSAGANRPNRFRALTPTSMLTAAEFAPSNSVLSAWFNTAAFTANGPGLPGGIGPGGADGNVTRDSLIGPGLRDIDLGIFRSFTFEHGIAFQFRAEATNAFNMVSLANPTARSRRATTARSPRRRHTTSHPAGRPVDVLDMF